MASVKFYDLCWSGLIMRSERRLPALIKWIGKNKNMLDVGCYEIKSDGHQIAKVFKDHDGSVVFDRFSLTDALR